MDMQVVTEPKTTVRPEIIAQFRSIAAQQKKTLQPLSDDLPLLETGLDSLCFAVLIARLDDTLGLDPLSNGDVTEFPVTVGDFIRLYEREAA